MQADDPVEAVDAFFLLWRNRLVESGFRAGCPIVAVAVGTNDDAPQLARSAAAVFARWQEALAVLSSGTACPGNAAAGSAPSSSRRSKAR